MKKTVAHKAAVFKCKITGETKPTDKINRTEITRITKITDKTDCKF